ncbi:class I SAM-dependent methyltransferase [Rhizobium sp. AN80A]|uniref:class I SAM-dependent methyltransferase n=1 Tax=Rhizobium sp. AN80A TaxID=3040673 RepID=UPI0024B35237|nr:class I SAM-dependent methyltransferase [Rhizobium sp. AN80A]
MRKAQAEVVETDVVLDIGCGIKPMNYYRPRLHIMVEPWSEYSDILAQRNLGDKSVMILKLGALEALRALEANSVDSVFLLDVIEHLEKDVGFAVLAEIDRVCRRQAVIFTPLGFMPQHMEEGEKDGWGLSGAEMQEHKSGWLPADFGEGWEFHVCETFHAESYNGEALEKVFGAFFAIRNYSKTDKGVVREISDIRRPLPSEIKLSETEAELAAKTSQLQGIQEMLANEREAYRKLRSNFVVRVLSRLKIIA